MANEKRNCNQICHWNDSSDGCIKPSGRICPMSNTEPDASGWGQVKVKNEQRLIKVCDATAVYNGIALYMAENAYLNDTALDVLKMVAKWLDEAFTVDAVEVVRCKDCKYWEDFHGKMFCGCADNQMAFTKSDDFCSYGERREGE